mgnify:CR=1 FL=1
MKSDLDQRLLKFFREHPVPMLASEIAAAIGEPVEDVRNAMRPMINDRIVFRHHCERGVLRYADHRPGETSKAAAAPTDTGTMKRLTDGISHVARDNDVVRRLLSLQLLGSHISMHLNQAMDDARAAIDSLRPEDQA